MPFNTLYLYVTIVLGLVCLQAERCCGFTALNTGFLVVDSSISPLLRRPLSSIRLIKRPLLRATDINKNDNTNSNSQEKESFACMGLSTELQAAIPWTKPTPIQALAIPQILQQNQNQTNYEYPYKNAACIWAQAPTGSGKTLVYAVSLFQKLLYQRPSATSSTTAAAAAAKTAKTHGIRSLILSPTRELAVQIGSTLSKLARKTSRSPRIVVIHGGVPMGPQLHELLPTNKGDRRMIDILVATPGRLVDLLTQHANERADTALQYKFLKALDQQQRSKKGSSSLSLTQLQELELDKPLQQQRQQHGDNDDDLQNMLQGLEYLVLDEADRLLSRAFEPEMDAVLQLMIPSKKKPECSVPTWLFSATFPKAIEPRVDQVLRRLGNMEPPIRLSCISSDRLVDDDNQVSSTLQKRLDRAKTATSATSVERIGPASTIQLRTIRLEKPSRTLALRRLLDDHPEWDRVLVFVGTRYSSEHVARKLRRVGISAAELHGKLDQEARLRRLRSFISGRNRVLLCTDLAARGLDIDCLPAVVNYDLPRSTTDFVHRVGRTGRAGRPGVAVTFVTPESESHLELIESRHLPKAIEKEVLPGLEPNEVEWAIKAEASRLSIPGVEHSSRGLAHDRMFGGIKGKRKSKKDRLREKAAREAALQERSDE